MDNLLLAQPEVLLSLAIMVVIATIIFLVFGKKPKQVLNHNPQENRSGGKDGKEK